MILVAGVAFWLEIKVGLTSDLSKLPSSNRCWILVGNESRVDVRNQFQ